MPEGKHSITAGRFAQYGGGGDTKKHGFDYGQTFIINLDDTDKGIVFAEADRDLSVTPDVRFCRDMKRLVGTDNFRIKLKKLQFKKRNKWQKSKKVLQP